MIIVLGSINVDLVCRVAAIPRPGETVLGSDYHLVPGGKGANQALAARRAGAAVRLVGTIGDDAMAEVALTELAAGGVDLSAVARHHGATGLAVITVEESGENTIVVSPGANAHSSAGQIPDGALAGGDTLLLQMEIPFAECMRAARAAAAAGARVILSVAPFAPVSPDDVGPVSILVVNEHEAQDFARHLGLAAGDTDAAVAGLAARLGRTVIATLGPAGALAVDASGPVRVPSLAVSPVDTTGAGDTFAGVLAALLDEGADLAAAMAHAAAAGALACLKRGAQPSFPSRAEIDAAMR